MRFHREGHRPLIFTAIIMLLALAAVQNLLPQATGWLLLLLVPVYALLLNFFRDPERPVIQPDDRIVYAPADGKVLVLEETTENEYFKDRRIQVSIFMSPLDVHVNRYPIGGKVEYAKYHPGKYLLAWNPKSSQENERTSVVLGNRYGTLLMRQIAGFLARRIVCYSETGDSARQGDDMGFIKLGSRVDLFLPLDATINVSLQQVVRGNQTIIAHLPEAAPA
jgi:phosphatidylserine decarboxylase